MKHRLLLLLISACILFQGFAQSCYAETFVVSDIRVEGLQRVSPGSVFNALPINTKDVVDTNNLGPAIRALFATGNFDDVQIGRDGTVLVIQVTERPSISEINIDGNKALKTEDLIKGLEGAGLAVGQVFQRFTLEGMRLELQRQYVGQGRYDAKIDTEVDEQPRNRVAVNITINEGTVATIKHINVVGNRAYDDEELTSEFELKTTGWFSFISGNDKYSKEKLKGDLETLESKYLDRGYIRFNMASTQVSVTPDRKAVYISITVDEGEKYTVGDVELSGDMAIPKASLKPMILVKEGQLFSQLLMTTTEENLTKMLGNSGYTFAKATGITKINEEDKIVDIKFFIDPGKRAYVRRVNFEGNTKTADEVLRREMRQMESAPASNARIENSKVRLERLGYFKEVEVETVEVPGTDDQVDVKYTVEEQSSGSIGASLGVSQDTGLILGGNIQQNNFLGSGKQIGIALNTSEYRTVYSFNYTDPYYTEDGVSRGFNLFFSSTDFEEVNIATYTTDRLGGMVNYGYPIGETERIGFGFGYTHTELDAGFGAVQEIIASPRFNEPFSSYDTYVELGTVDGIEVPVIPTAPVDFNDAAQIAALGTTSEPGFIDEQGESFDDLIFNASWSENELNRGRLPTAGFSQSMGWTMTLPGSDLEYFKLTYEGQYFKPLTKSFTLRFRTELGYGDGYGGTPKLPFFENYFAGGFSSVRGFKSNTLGPRSRPADSYNQTLIAYDPGDPDADPNDPTTAVVLSEVAYVVDPDTGKIVVSPVYSDDDEGDPFGGNISVVGGVELLFPMPFIKDQRSIRSSLFFDFGNVFDTECSETQLNCFDVELGELRYSMGVGVTWITGFGPLTFSLAKPLNQGDFDETEIFQFSLGQGF